MNNLVDYLYSNSDIQHMEHNKFSLLLDKMEKDAVQGQRALDNLVIERQNLKRSVTTLRQLRQLYKDVRNEYRTSKKVGRQDCLG